MKLTVKFTKERGHHITRCSVMLTPAQPLLDLGVGRLPIPTLGNVYPYEDNSRFEGSFVLWSGRADTPAQRREIADAVHRDVVEAYCDAYGISPIDETHEFDIK
jgi:hypothetical protein